AGERCKRKLRSWRARELTATRQGPGAPGGCAHPGLHVPPDEAAQRPALVQGRQDRSARAPQAPRAEAPRARPLRAPPRQVVAGGARLLPGSAPGAPPVGRYAVRKSTISVRLYPRLRTRSVVPMTRSLWILNQR